ncbi:MAG: baseplate J/gp47 family protein [Lachnospiraceae bacterium]|nr:baseplate J/gp47 family protein [Lachnospiraceae bacterium]
MINYSARMNLPRYATGDFLDALAELFYDVPRLQPEPAKCMLRFEISVIPETAYTIPRAIQVTVDGKIIFQTTETLMFPAGQDHAEVPAVCLTAGTVGNGFAPGQIDKMVDEQFLYFKDVYNVTESGGGTEKESDNDFYNRMRESMESHSTAGAGGSYIYHGKTASAAISDIVADSPEPGIADIRVMLHDGELPGEDILKKVEEKLSADDVRPMCDLVRVSAPETTPFHIDITYYVPEEKTAATAEIMQNVETAVQNYITWQTERMGRDINPSYLYGLLMQTGIKRAEIREPTFMRLEKKYVAILDGEPQMINGGTEDE